MTWSLRTATSTRRYPKLHAKFVPPTSRHVMLHSANHGGYMYDMVFLQGHDELVAFLLSAGANPNAVNDQGRSPLYRAAFNGHANTVSLLLKVRASLTLLAARPVQCPHGVLH